MMITISTIRAIIKNFQSTKTVTKLFVYIVPNAREKESLTG